ncbi:MAG: hypothetical protein ABSB79_04850 [Syntrophales bacterium]|jgi:hypothetical protein
MFNETFKPPRIMESVYGIKPRQRAADLSGIVSLNVTDLFPSIAGGYLQKQGIADIRKMTESALASVDMKMIKSGDSVNLLCSEHGFYLLEGDHYCEMLKTIRDVVEKRTGCTNIRLRVAGGMFTKEAEEVIQHFGLRPYFNGKATGIHAFDRGIPIETEIGTLYGLAKAYDADWIIHASYDEPRDLYFYRMIDRILKPFAMSYARFETRSVFHGNFGNRSCSFIQRAIFDSPFVQKKFAFGCFLRMTPAGITGVDADNDLDRIGRKITMDVMRDYGKMLRLFFGIDECIAVLDGGRWGYYLHAGGIVFGCLENSEYDVFDLSQPAAFGYFDLLAKLAEGQEDAMANIMLVNPAIKAVVVNQSWPGIPMADVPMCVPTIVVGQDLAELMANDPSNPLFMEFSQTASTLEEAMERAREISRTDKVIIFDGSFGCVNLSPSLAQYLIKKAPTVEADVEENLLPMWLKQRGIDPKQISSDAYTR